MKKFVMLFTLLLSSTIYAAPFDVMGRYQSAEGDQVAFSYSDRQNAPVFMEVAFSKDTEFDYLRYINLSLTLSQFNQIFDKKQLNNFKINYNDMTDISVSKVVSQTHEIINLTIEIYTTADKKKIGAQQFLQFSVSKDQITSMNLRSTKMRTGLFVSYGLKEVYQSSADLSKTLDGFMFENQLVNSERDLLDLL